MQSNNKPSPLFWNSHVEHWQASGLTQAAYCQQNELVAHQFSYWKRKLISAELTSAEASSNFVRVDLNQIQQPASGLSLQFTDGIRLVGITQANVEISRHLIEALR